MSAPYPEAGRSYDSESDLHDAPTRWLRCECGYTGTMNLQRTRAGTPPGSPHPPEDSTIVAICPRCGLEHDEYGDAS